MILPVQKDLTQKKEALKKKLIKELTLDLTSIESFMRWVEDQDRSNPKQTQIDWETYKNPSKDDMNDLMTYWIQWRAASDLEKTVINPALTPEPKDADTIQSLLKKMNGIDDGTIMAFTKYQTTQPHEFELLDKWSSFKRSHAMELVKEINGLANNQLTPIEFDAFLKHSDLKGHKFYSLPDIHKTIRDKWTSFKEERETQALAIMLTGKCNQTDKNMAHNFLMHLKRQRIDFKQCPPYKLKNMFNYYIKMNLEEHAVESQKITLVNVRRGIPPAHNEQHSQQLAAQRQRPRPLAVPPRGEHSGEGERTASFFDGLSRLILGCSCIPQQR
jgi:hypothetical protein